MSVLQLLDAFHVWYYPMKHRWVYYLRFDLGFSLVPVLLPVAFVVLACLLLRRDFLGIFVSSVVTLFVHFFFGFEAAVAVFSLIQVVWALYRFVDIGEFLFWFLVFFTGFEVLALIHWVLLPFGIVSPLTYFADLEMAFFYILGQLSPLIMLFIFIIAIFNIFNIKFESYLLFLKMNTGATYPLKEEKIGINPWILLVLSILFSVVAGILPYVSYINPNKNPVGVDVHWYVEWMMDVEQDIFNAFKLWRGSRPLILLLIYSLEHTLGFSMEVIIKYLPILFNPLLVLSVFILVWGGSNDIEWASMASLFTALGITITVEMYSYYLANFLALILIYFSIGLLFYSIKSKNKIYFILSSFLGSLSIFTHTWTFIQYYVATLLYLLYKYIKTKDYEGCKIILIYLGIIGFIDLLKGFLMKSIEGIGSVVYIAPRLGKFLEFWNNNIFIFRDKYGGLLSNSVLLGLAAFGAYMLSNKKRFPLFLTILLAISSPLYFISNEEIMSRLLFNIPLEILTGLGLLYFFRNKYVERENKIISLFFIIIYMIVYLLRSLSNLI